MSEELKEWANMWGAKVGALTNLDHLMKCLTLYSRLL